MNVEDFWFGFTLGCLLFSLACWVIHWIVGEVGR
jgi:hypothetical protein